MTKEDNNNKNDSKDDAFEFVKADDGEALQALFEKQCDKDGLMTKKSLVSIPMIADLLVRSILNTANIVKVRVKIAVLIHICSIFVTHINRFFSLTPKHKVCWRSLTRRTG